MALTLLFRKDMRSRILSFFFLTTFLLSPLACVTTQTRDEAQKPLSTTQTTTYASPLCGGNGQAYIPCSSPRAQYLLPPQAWMDEVHWLNGAGRPLVTHENEGQYFGHPDKTEAGLGGAFSVPSPLWGPSAYATTTTTTTYQQGQN